jgi:hypothetical protein
MKSLRSLTPLFAVVLAGSGFAQTLKLKYADFDPGMAIPPVPAALAARNTNGPAHYIVQFQHAASADERHAVSAYGVAEGYLPDDGFVVATSPGGIAAIQNLPGVRWVGAFHPAYKLSQDIGTRPFYTPSRLVERLQGICRLTITLFDLEPASKAAAALGADGFLVSHISNVGPRWVIDAEGPIASVRDIAQIESVAWIEESPERTLRNDVTKWVVQSNVSNQTPIWDKGLHGEGQVGGLIDGKIYLGHDMFRDPSNNTPGPNHRKVIRYQSSSGFTGGDTHGTHTAGTLAGDQEPITGQTYRNGMAYKAKIAFANLNDVWGGGLYDALVGAHSVGARVHSNSWGDDGTTQYTSDCQQIDQYSWDNESGLVAFAVTNQNSLKTPENAKSVLAVGASEQAPNQSQHGSGGTGPTSDGRRKPEIYAPGVGIYSARSGTTNQYISLTGTSMACPAITGCAALVRQYYQDGWFRYGIRNLGVGIDPSGALVRATIMNAGVDMTGIAGYPSNREGWGRLLLHNVLWFAGDEQRTLVWDVRRANGLVQGATYRGYIDVVSNGMPLRVTMTFTDYPAQVFTNFAPVNDLNLTVTGPSGTYFGNVISNGQSSTGGSADAINSTEMVMLNSPVAGRYTITVKAAAVNQGGKQGFAIVANGHVRAASRNVRH